MKKYDLIIVKVTIDMGGDKKQTMIHKFTSESAFENYLNNRFIINYEVIAKFQKLSFENFTDLWKKDWTNETIK